MGVRPWFILAAVAFARIGFGYQYQTVASLGPDLTRLFQFDYTTLGTLIGAFMMLGAFVALPVGLLARKLGDRLVLSGGLALMVLGPVVSAPANAPTGIGVGRGAAGVGVGAAAVIVLQSKVVADWHWLFVSVSDKDFRWADKINGEMSETHA
jgi:predicted MFS family arabinose efflux permease